MTYKPPILLEFPFRSDGFLAEKVARNIQNIIDINDLKPGDSLGREVDLVRQLGISRPTLRAAIRFLELSGRVKTRPGVGGGVFVAAPEVPVAMAVLTRHIVALGQTLPVFLSIHMPFFAHVVGLAAIRANTDQRSQMAELAAKLVAAEDCLVAFRPIRLELRLCLLRATGLSSLEFVGEALTRAYIKILDGELRLGATEAEKVRAVKMAEVSFITPLINGDHCETRAMFDVAANGERAITSQTIEAGMVPENAIPNTLFANFADAPGATRLAEHVARAIRRDIHFKHPVGSLIGSIGDITAHYGVSQEICREALGLLSLHGLLAIRRGHGGGVFAAKLSMARLSDVIVSALRECDGLKELEALVIAISETISKGDGGQDDIHKTIEFLNELIAFIDTAIKDNHS